MTAGARWLLAPWAIGVVVLVLGPALATFVLAFFDYGLLTAPRFIGLDNLGRLLDDPDFTAAIRNSVIFALAVVPLRVVGASVCALVLHRRFAGVGVHRTIAFLPSTVPESALALLWLFLLNPLYGPVNVLLEAVGLPGPAWLTSPFWAMAAMVVIAAFTFGEGFVIALAARRAIPDESYELARLEGASSLVQLRRITLPLMAPLLALLAVRDTAVTLQVSFTPSYLLTDGGPDRATLFLPLYGYDVSFEQLQYGYGAAITLSMAALTLVLGALGALLVRRLARVR